MPQDIRLTQYSHGAGCGCKISPADLEILLQAGFTSEPPPGSLLVDNSSRDDAAVYDLGNGTGIVSTTDFFMPIVDDPFDFGRVAATNAISDIYAMGGTPIMAIAVFAWPTKKLPLDVGRLVIAGGRQVCTEAGATLGGGHSIDAPEPIFGLAVTGLVQLKQLKRNSTARPGNRIYLTKPLGVGILTTAQKQKVLQTDHQDIAVESMCTLNRIGAKFGQLEGVTAMTDVTGFGLGGHLIEVCEGSGVSAVVEFDRIPLLPHVEKYLEMGCSPGGTARNIASAGEKLGSATAYQRTVLCDPQTSGGLLVTVDADAEEEFLAITAQEGLTLQAIGQIIESGPGPVIGIS
ncbi:MAG: selenide, water dikinase SelD [Gammaproteobacteria bacterium]|nr:selenide, water dikinase SelD [Gammaproteobacteria bacterium]